MVNGFFKFFAAFLGVMMGLAHFPQAYKIYKNKSVKDISILTYSIFTIGSYTWFIYGIIINDWPIIVSYLAAVVGTSLVMILIFKYRKLKF